MLKLLFPILFSLLLTTKVWGEPLSYYYYDNGDELNQIIYDFKDEFSNEYKLDLLIKELLKSNNNFIPLGSELMDVKIINGYAELNFSNEILDYGGNYYEIRLINQILETTLNFPDINYVTFLIDGKLVPLNEGTTVFTINKIIDLD